MIDPGDRFVFVHGRYDGHHMNPRTVAHMNVWDWDQLRIVKVTGTARIFPIHELHELKILAKFIDLLAPEVTAISVDDNGLLTKVSTDPAESAALFVPYPRFSLVKSRIFPCRTIQIGALAEVDRIAPGVDLRRYKYGPNHNKLVAFKFNPFGDPFNVENSWDEVNILSRLPSHPNIVPFREVVLEGKEFRVVGFTTQYIAGDTLDNTKITFRLKHLQQLMEAVDFLNKEMGIMHQDIAPRNLIIDRSTDNLLLFNFNRATNGSRPLRKGGDDVRAVYFTLYELITCDSQLIQDTPVHRRSFELWQMRSWNEWVPKRPLDSKVSVFRNVWNKWAVTRSDQDFHFAPGRLVWPRMPEVPEFQVEIEYGPASEGEALLKRQTRRKEDAKKLGHYCFDWQRPPYSRKLEPLEEKKQAVGEKET